MNELEIRTIMDMCKNYLNYGNVEKLSKRTQQDIIQNLMELNSTIEGDTFSANIEPEIIRELYSMVEECSKLKGKLRPLWISLEHTFFDFMVEHNFMQDMKAHDTSNSLRDYELAKI